MKIIPIVLLLIIRLPMVSLTYGGVTNPLMMFSEPKQPIQENFQHYNVEDDPRSITNEEGLRGSFLTPHEENQHGIDPDPTEPWNFIYVSPDGKTIRLVEKILNGEAALKTEISNSDFLLAFDQARILLHQAQEYLDQINNHFYRKRDQIENELHREQIKESTEFMNLVNRNRGPDNTVFLPLIILENSQKAQEAETKKLIALSEAKAAAIEYTSLKALSTLPQRNVILKSGSQDNKVQHSIQELGDCSKSIITSLQSQLINVQDDQKKKKYAELIIKTATLAEKTEWLMLKYHTPFYITDAKNRLNNLFDKIAAENDQQDLQRSLEKINLDFLLAEAESPETAFETINQITTNLDKELEELKQGIERDNSNMKIVDPQNQEGLRKIIDYNTRKSQLLELAILSYKLIKNELMIKTELGSLPDLKKSINEDLKILEEKNISLETLNKFKNVLNNPEIVPADLVVPPAKAFDFLSSVRSLNASCDNMIITGEHGEIILENLKKNNISKEENFLTKPSLDPRDKDRKKWANGIDLIEFAIARTYGIEAVRAFDAYFKNNKQFHISLSVKDLKIFLEQKITIPAAHFLSPLVSMEKIITALNNASEKNLIKWNEKVFKFNFLPSEPIVTSEQTLDEVHRQELIEGIKHARKTIEKIFENFDTPISPNRVQHILRRFDTKFSDSSSMCVKDLQDFLSQEGEKIKHSPTDLFDDYFPASINIRSTITLAALSGMVNTAISLFAFHLMPTTLVSFAAGFGVAFPVGYFFGSRSNMPAAEERR